MNLKTRLIVISILFVLAALLRYGSWLDVSNKLGRQTLTYQTLGTGGDPDYQLYCAREYAKQMSDEAVYHYDYFFLCPLLSIPLNYFTFVESFELYAYATILIGSLAVVMPFALFSSFKKFEVGGLLASLLLLINPVMINNSDGRYYIYPLVVLFYIILSFILFKTLYTRSLHWLVALGTMAVVQGISKPFLYVNDMAFFLLFPVLYCITSIRLHAKFPYVSIELDRSQFKLGIIPTIVYFIGIIGFEVLHYSFTKGRFFLSDLFLPHEYSLKDEVLGASLHFEGSIKQQAENIVSLGYYALHTLISYLSYTFIILLFSITTLIIKTKQPLKWLFTSLIGISILSLSMYAVVHSFLFPNIYVGILPYTVMQTTVMACFIWFLFLIALFTSKGLILITFHIFYFGALAMTLSAVNQPQLFVTIIIWYVLLIAYAVNSVWSTTLSYVTQRTYIAFIGFILLLFIVPVSGHIRESMNAIKKHQSEKEYLKWVQSELPQEGYILGGMDDSLPLLSKYTHKKIIYNSLYMASVIEPQAMSHEVYQIPLLHEYIQTQVYSQDGIPLYFLDNNVTFWNQYLEKGGSGNFPAGLYKLEVAATNSELNRKIYRLLPAKTELK